MVRKDNLIMKKISKHVQVLMITLSIFLLFPTLAFAEGDNPFRKLAEKMKWNFGVLDGLDFVFTIIMIVLSLLVIAASVILIIRIVLKAVKVKKGQSLLKDKDFWMEVAATTLLLALLFSGALFNIIASIYDWTNKQKIGENSTSQIEIQVKDVPVRNA